MTSTVTNDVDFIAKAIERAIRERISEVVDEEIAKAQTEVLHRMRGEVDKIALSLSNHYQLERSSQELVITVRKELGKP